MAGEGVAAEALTGTVGVEEEFCIVDAESGSLRVAADEVVLRAQYRVGEQAEAELHRSQVETGTAVCGSLAELRTELERLRAEVRAAAAEAGCAVLATGTHPTATPAESTVNPTKERYRRLEREYQAVAREQLVNGCHVHVGIGDRDLAIDTLNRTRPWVATVLALSANSPFWAGADTGYDSYRTEVWTRWPLTGMPEPLPSWAAYDELVAALQAVEAAPDATFLYWDVRPSARYETLEFRAADAGQRVDDVVMVAGLWRALALTCAADAAAGIPAAPLRNEIVQAARWRAARYGLHGTLVDVASGRTAPAARVVGYLLGHLRAALEALGDWDEVLGLVEQTIAGGNGAARQRAAFARRGSLDDVVAMLRV